MYYDPGRHHREQQAPPDCTGFLRHSDGVRKRLFDSMEAAAQPRSEPEPQRVMDGLLRECLKRRPLAP